MTRIRATNNAIYSINICRPEFTRTSFKTRLRLFGMLTYKCRRNASEGLETTCTETQRACRFSVPPPDRRRSQPPVGACLITKLGRPCRLVNIRQRCRSVKFYLDDASYPPLAAQVTQRSFRRRKSKFTTRTNKRARY
jgi:hypothetical protein